MSNVEIAYAFHRLAELVGSGESVDEAADIVAGEWMEAADRRGKRVNFSARDLPSKEWLENLNFLLRCARQAVAFGDSDAAERWQNVCEHWLTRYSTEDGGEGNDE